MDADLTTVVAAFAELDDGELAALINATNHLPQAEPGLLAWVEGACDWELNRRRGLDHPLLPPEAAITPEEDAVSVDAAVIIGSQFAQDKQAKARAVVALFDAIIGLLTGSGHRPDVTGSTGIASTRYRPCKHLRGPKVVICVTSELSYDFRSSRAVNWRRIAWRTRNAYHHKSL